MHLLESYKKIIDQYKKKIKHDKRLILISKRSHIDQEHHMFCISAVVNIHKKYYRLTQKYGEV